MTPEFAWLHISDIHFKAASAFDNDVVLNSLLDSLRDLTNDQGIQCVVMSGDVAFSGKKDEYSNATVFFDKMIRKLELTRDRLLVIPGNHDVDRAASKGLVRTLASGQDADEYFSSGEEIIHITKKMSAFRDWHNAFFQGIRVFPDRSTCFEPIALDIGSRKVNFLLINTACFCIDDNDSGKLFLGRPCVTRSIEKLSNVSGPRDLNIAVMHHPFSWLNGDECMNIKSSLRSAVDCILTGHLHENDIEVVSSLAGGALHLSAGATYQTSKYPNSALICRLTGNALTVRPIRFEKTPTPHWNVDPSIYAKNPSHERVYQLKEDTRSQDNKSHNASQSTLKRVMVDAETSPKRFDANLFQAPSGEVLYVSPRLMRTPQIVDFEKEDDIIYRYKLEEIALSEKSFVIFARSEYGGSTICEALENEIQRRTENLVCRRKARDLPNYRKKLEKEFSGFTKHPSIKNIIILDDVEIEEDERLLKEISSCDRFSRMIAVVRHRGVDSICPRSGISLLENAETAYIWSLGREDIRTLSEKVFQSTDQVLVSQLVEKVYRDLLSLCIPLTPTNVIMYLRVLFKEGDYAPINKVDILAKYLQDSLQTTGDTYGEILNAKNKMDIVAALAFDLYSERKSSFDNKYWFDFTSVLQKQTLLEFDSEKLLRELIGSKVLIRSETKLKFRYAFFFEFFLGRHLVSRPHVLQKFVSAEEYLEIAGVIEVITGLSSDNGALLATLSQSLEDLLRQFSQRYIEPEFDILKGAVWPDRVDDEERIWKPVTKRLEEGPKKTTEIDALKSSFIAEARTADQEVRYSKFLALETALFSMADIVRTALRNCDDASAEIKLRAYEATLRTSLATYQIGTVLSPIISKTRYTQWGGVAFFDFHKANNSAEGKELGESQIILRTISSIAVSVAMSDAEEVATSKLAPLFRNRATSTEDGGFLDLCNFFCVMHAKGTGWQDAMEIIIRRIDKNAVFLYIMLKALVWQLESEILQIKDRESLKKLLALIQAKRGLGKQNPGARAVSRVQSRLEDSDYRPFKKGIAQESAED